jgi:hypothetical protein
MQIASLSQLVSMVRAEAGHSLSTAQGLNTIESLKHLIRRTEYELWTAFNWPTLTARWDISIQSHQTEYQYPADMQFDQIRNAFWAPENATTWHPVQFGIPEDAIMPYGEASKVDIGSTIELWDTFYNTDDKETRVRVWPTPNRDGFLRLKGQRSLNCLMADDDCCTLDAVVITLYASAELLGAAKSELAGPKSQKADRHLRKFIANETSDKLKVSTFGATRGVNGVSTRFRQFNHL